MSHAPASQQASWRLTLSKSMYTLISTASELSKTGAESVNMEGKLLVAVRIVCTDKSHVAALPHVARTIDSFIWSCTSQWTLESATKLGSVRLLHRLLKHERPGFNRRFREVRLWHAIDNAWRSPYDVSVLEWWLKSYLPGQSVVSMTSIFQLAIQQAQLPILKWLYQETEGVLPQLESRTSCHDPDVVIWLQEHAGPHWRVNLSFYGHCRFALTLQSIQTCFAYEDEDSSFKIYGTSALVEYLIEREEFKSLTWLLKHRPKVFTPAHFRHALLHNRLEAAKWLEDNLPCRFFPDPSRPFTTATAQPDMKLVAWVISEFDWADENKRKACVVDAMVCAAGLGSLEMFKLVVNIPMEGLTPDQGFSEAVEKLDIGPGVMNSAAENGHLEIVVWLHTNGCSCTTQAMNMAAAVGHLEMVKWLHENRSEGCTSSAMDEAAANGHLDVVEWLHKYRSEGCTSSAMDEAAANGHLNMVQWLHENRAEGCTTYAMDCAAGGGYLSVVQFLHANRHEGYTSNAIENAAANGHFDTFEWLYSNTSEPFDPDINEWMERTMDTTICDNILKCQLLYATHDRFGWFVDQFVKFGDFEMMESVLNQARDNKVSSLGSEYVDFL